MRTPPLRANFIHARGCKPICEKLLTLPYPEEFLFATNDVLLKRIFINCNAPYRLNGLLFNVFSKKEYNQLMDYIENRMRNRVKPDFGDNPHAYFQKLIEKEKRELQILLDH